jgi:flagellar biosynthesis protein FlhG
MHVVPIASGKGGVGKSLLSTNLAVALGQAGKRVTLVDLDLGGSNLHLMLGVSASKRGIGHFLADKSMEFEEVVTETDFKNVRLVPGEGEIPGLANLSSSQKGMIIRRLSKLDSDFVFLDLGAGTSFNTLDFFLMSARGIIVTTPNPTALVNAYLFLKNAVFRMMSQSFKRKSEAAKHLSELSASAAGLQRVYIPRLLEQVAEIDPESHAAFMNRLRQFQPRLIMNMLDDPKDGERATKLRRSCREYLDIDPEHLGIVYRDDLQDIALASRLPIVVYKPESVLSQAVYRIADKIMQLAEDEEGFVELEEVEDTYQAAEAEAEVDFGTKMGYVEELLHSGTLSQGDLVETVKSQQIEIQQLKKENRLLKSKLVRAMGEGFRP